MEDLLTCSICCEGYVDLERPPVLLPRCGHSFCRPCVALIQTSGCVICPTCRTDQRIETASNLPTEYSLLAIINAQKNAMEEVCKRHSVKLSFWCRTCNIATCGECLFEDHPTHSHDVIRAARYITDMKHLAHDIAFKFMDALDKREQNFYKNVYNCGRRISNAIRNVGILRKDMDEARNLMRGIKEHESISTATSVAEAAKFLGLKWNIQDVNFNKINKEDTVDEEKERESPKRKDNEDKICSNDIKPEKKEKQSVSKSKSMATFHSTVKNDEPDNSKKINSSSDNKENERNESKERSDVKEADQLITDEIKNEENKLNEKDKNNKSLLAANSKPRGRLARKALAAKMAETVKLDQTKEEDSNKEADSTEGENVTANDLQKSTPDSTQENETQKPSTETDQLATNNTSDENAKHTPEDEPTICNEEKIKVDEQHALASSNSVPTVDGKTMDLLQIPGLEMVIEGADGRLARTEWGQYGIHIFCHQFQQLSYDVLIKASVLSSLIPSKNPIVFMEISADQTTLGKVYIKLFGHLRRAHNFLALCLGNFGFSYQSTRFLQVYNQGEPGERLLGGDYEFNNGRGGQGIIEDLEWNGDYAQPMESGMITAAGSGQLATNSLFLLCTEGDDTRNFSCPFGVVTTGLHYIKEAINASPIKKIWISDCGVLLQPPNC